MWTAMARTYSAAADNYQAGYRLKLVDGQAPLDVPYSGVGTVGHFRLCFTCHDSAPFMDEFNTDTNFRADIDDTGATLDPPANRHWYHLVYAGLYYDSDFDGDVSPDSGMSCTACHNVHGPKLKSGATHAPGMIRTGELIGREIEGALNLEYFINPYPDTTTSPDNELSGSTGGMMLEYSPTGNGSIARNGVCNMCHNEAEPYWRTPSDILSCDKCHINVAHTVEVGPSDLSDGTSCSNCHVVDNWLEIEGTTHNVATNGDGSCVTCHKSPRQEVIDAIASGPRPTRCLPCHSDKTAEHGNPHTANNFAFDSNCQTVMGRRRTDR